MMGLLAMIAKIPALAKVAIFGLAVITAAAVEGLPLRDICFDYVIFIALSAVVTGMPEPDTDLTGWRFFYTWIYRTGHLLVGSGTAFFRHAKRWKEISEIGPEEKKPHETI